MKKFRIVVVILLLLGVAALAVLYISTHDIVVLNPKGMIGIKERHLIITASLLMLLVVIPVFVFTWFFAWRYRASNEKARHEPDWECGVSRKHPHYLTTPGHIQNAPPIKSLSLFPLCIQ